MAVEKALPNEEEVIDAQDTTGEESNEDYSEIEQEAMQHGWRPEGVEGKRNLSAEEFMDRKELYSDLSALKKRLRRQEEKYSALEKHYNHVSEIERQKVLAELKAKKAQALEDQDYDAVVEIDEAITEQKQKPAESKDTHNEIFDEWVKDNDWYNSDPDMRAYADMVGRGYYQPGMNYEDVYSFVAKEVKSRFADKFMSPKDKPTMVQGSSKGRSSPRSTKHTVRDLPDEAKQVMRTLVRAGAMTEEKYLKDYFGE